MKLPRMIWLVIGWSGYLCLATPNCVISAPQDDKTFSDQQLEYFENKVRPLLVERCNECHGPEANPIEGGLNLATRKSILTGGDTGPAIVPGHATESLLIDAINYGEVYEMPPDTKMSDQEIAILTKWVNDGAAWPKNTEVEVDAKVEFDLQARKKAHWCWSPIRKPKIPQVKNEQWPSDAIDNFILARLEEEKLAPAATAPRQTLIRRAYFDLTGLPPTSEQVNAFLADDSPDAFKNVIDGLLASPRFGERWARHWMDLTRYAETGGHEFDYEIPHAFEYRDYVIRAFNDDVPYNLFVQEHIAGDLLDNPRRNPLEDFDESVLGTGFWFLGEAKHGPVDSKGEEARTIDNQIDVMTKTFLGLTVACARCHDHKFDAISTEDYYALSGFLQSSRRQEAMLDPKRTIETNCDEAKRKVERASGLIEQLSERLISANTSTEKEKTVNQVSKYITAAIELLRDDPSWNRLSAIKVEGEKLKQLSVTAGETLVQKIKKRDQLEWSGSQQYWWKHGKAGDVWKLEFEVPVDVETNCEVSGVFTTASDYGTAKISINDTVVKETVDFFTAELQTVNLNLGKRRLKPGKNVLTIELLKRNEAASPSNMVGIDLLEIQPLPEKKEEATTIQAVAKRDGLKSDLLGRLIESIKSLPDSSAASELGFLKNASLKKVTIDANYAAQLKSKADQLSKQDEKFIKDSTQFAAFGNGLPTGWFKTGFALDDRTSKDPGRFSSEGSLVADSAALNSGQFGNRFFGVVRSPTFELKHSHIHYRIRGNNVTVRLIIDGFTMDSYNALLFKGCKFNIKDSGEFSWQTQAGDIKNHLGSRAHLEIIDHGDGFFELDEIRFSNGAKPGADSNPLMSDVGTGGFESREAFAQSVSEAICHQLASDDSAAFDALAGWVVSADLVDLFEKNQANQTGLARPANTGQVSFKAGRKGASSRELVSELATVRQQIAAINEKTPHPRLAIGMTDGTGEEEKIFIRGNHKTLGKVATRRFLSALSDRPLNPADASGRKQLAFKITAPNNPLTSRVAVNRVWHHLFGRGIVESVDNFGVLGKPPTHPELLDYLATEFVKDRQSIKRLIKRLMLTTSYQMASTPNEAAGKVDPDNQLLHRARIRRLQGEAIRDSILQASGELDLKMYGPPVPIHLTPFMDGRGRPQKSGPLNGDGRRSIYIAVRRNFLSPMMLAFDTPIPFNATGKRNQSNVPAQALILMNDPFVIQQADKWAEKLVVSDQSIEDRVTAIYETALSRSPNENELESGIAFVRQQANELGVKDDEMLERASVWRDLCHVMFNLKEFIYIE